MKLFIHSRKVSIGEGKAWIFSNRRRQTLKYQEESGEYQILIAGECIQSFKNSVQILAVIKITKISSHPALRNPSKWNICATFFKHFWNISVFPYHINKTTHYNCSHSVNNLTQNCLGLFSQAIKSLTSTFLPLLHPSGKQASITAANN